MKREVAMGGGSIRLLRWIAASLFCLAMVGCAGQQALSPQHRFDDAGVEPVLHYYQTLTRMSAAELGRERTHLAALPGNANTQMRTALLLGLTRGPQELGRALALLEGIMKSTDAAAIALQPLARLMAENYAERQKLDAQSERLMAQAQEGQRKAIELQEKIDRLTEIERTLPSRLAKPLRPGAGS